MKYGPTLQRYICVALALIMATAFPICALSEADVKIYKERYIDTPLDSSTQSDIYVEYEATMSDEQIAAGYNYDTLLNSTISIIMERLTAMGYTEVNIAKYGSGIGVRVLNVSDNNAVLDLIGTTAKLEFLDPDGNVFMGGQHLDTAYAITDESGKPAIMLLLTIEGTALFGDMTAKNIGKKISIYLDDELLMSGKIIEAMYGGSLLVTGHFTEVSARIIALQLQSGSLPLDLCQIWYGTFELSEEMGMLH